MNKFGAVIVAAGNSSRMGSNIKKPFIELKEKPIIAYTVGKFEEISQLEEIILVTGEEYVDFCNELKSKYGWKKTKVITGGKERQNSVHKGILALKNCSYVLVHDGVRPFVYKEHILKVMEETLNKGACSLAVPVKDTIKICSPTGEIEKGLDRKTLWAMQTPQGFNLSVLKKAYVDFIENNHVTDDAALMEIAGYKVFVVEGSYENIKITTAEDLIFAQCLLDLEESRRLK